MQKNVLLIENDTSFARAMSQALESRGFGVRTSPDGKEGFELAKALRPDCVVLCVELPGLSGYSWCNRLKKDGDLRAIPLVITSAEATPETFEQHRKLKTRAEDYLLKPFPPETLVEHVGALVGLPEPAEEIGEAVVLDDVQLEGEPPPAAAATGEDADLKQLDDAFDSITRGDEPSTGEPPERPLTLLPDADEAPARSHLDREMEAALASLAREAAEVSRTPAAGSRPAARMTPAPSRAPARIEPAIEEETPILLEDVEVLGTVDDGALQAARDEAEALRAEVEQVRAEADALRAEADALREAAEGARAEADSLRVERDAFRDEGREARDDAGRARDELSRLQAENERLRGEVSEVSRLAAAREEELDTLRDRLAEASSGSTARAAERDAAARRADELEAALREARAAAERLQGDVASARADADAARADAGERRAQADALRGQLEAAQGELAAERDGAAALRAGFEARESEAAARIQELESQAADAEEKAFLAEQQARAQEKVREKTRTALAMVLKLLEERGPDDQAS